jgi:transglutaminase/protease-like cytokinesis protein 3
VPPNQNYAIIDSLSKTIRYKNDLRRLTSELTDNYTSEFDKSRAIFIWITDNIAYDYKFINKGKKIKLPKCKPGQNCSAKQLAWEDNYLHKIITNKKAICDGYSQLFKRMCGYAGISCSMVDGYTKSEPAQVGTMGTLNHSWNAIKIDGNYYFIDATWAAGGCDKTNNSKLGKFKKHFENYYWLTPTYKLSRDHFPKDSVWVRNSKYTNAKLVYKNEPYIKQNMQPLITILTPETGL